MVTVLFLGYPGDHKTLSYGASFEPFSHPAKKALFIPFIQMSSRDKGQRAPTPLSQFPLMSHWLELGHMAMPKAVTAKRMSQQGLNGPGLMFAPVAEGLHSEQSGLSGS